MDEDLFHDHGYFSFITFMFRQRALMRGEVVVPWPEEVLDLLLITHLWTHPLDGAMGFK